jgi:hypothetical protein
MRKIRLKDAKAKLSAWWMDAVDPVRIIPAGR